MKRRVIHLVLLLIAGAIVNVAVAWAIVRYSRETSSTPAARLRALFDADITSDGRVVTYKEFQRIRFGITMRGIPGEDASKEMLVQLAVGWPLPCFWNSTYTAGNGWQDEGLRLTVLKASTGLYTYTRNLPLQPSYGPLAINTIFYAAILWGGWVVFFAPGMVMRTLRRRRGLCAACAYPVGTSTVCTECGKPLKTPKAESQIAESPE